jgi:hypothetical protein
MFDFLFEGGLALYIVALLGGLFCFILYSQRRDRRYLTGVAAFAGLALLLFLLDKIRETDMERSVRTVHEVTDLVNGKQLDRAFGYFANDFTAYGMNRQEMRQAAEAAMRKHNVRNIRVKSIQVMKQDRERRTITLRFNVTADSDFSSDWALAACEVDCQLDDQNCRVKSFRIYNPLVNSQEPWDVFR